MNFNHFIFAINQNQINLNNTGYNYKKVEKYHNTIDLGKFNSSNFV